MTTPAPLLARCGLAIARFCVAAWIGAAVLFVIVGVREVTTPEFTSEVKDRLVTLRFPAYYLAGGLLTGLGVLATGIAAWQSPSRTVGFALAALVIAGGVMAVDYVWIYSPLAALVTPPGQPRTQAFVSLHHWSMRINTVHLTACFLAAMGLSVADGRRNPRAESGRFSLWRSRGW